MKVNKADPLRERRIRCNNQISQTAADFTIAVFTQAIYPPLGGIKRPHVKY